MIKLEYNKYYIMPKQNSVCAKPLGLFCHTNCRVFNTLQQAKLEFNSSAKSFAIFSLIPGTLKLQIHA